MREQDDADGGGDMAAPADPYASAKANLRDTVKWLATSLAALAAALLAGASIVGISGLNGRAFAAALISGGAGLICVFGALGIMLRLLTSESFFLSEIDDPKSARIKARLVKYTDNYLSPVFTSLDNFLSLREDAIADIRRDCLTDDERADQAEALAFFPKIVAQTTRVVGLAHFEVMRDNLERSKPALMALALGAIAGIGTFTVLVGSRKDAPPQPAALSLAEFTPGKDWFGLSHALTETCGAAAASKVEVIDRPQAGWVDLRLLSPEACAGMRLAVPARLVAEPQPPVAAKTPVSP